jgi:hypothetical protein
VEEVDSLLEAHIVGLIEDEEEDIRLIEFCGGNRGKYEWLGKLCQNMDGE